MDEEQRREVAIWKVTVLGPLVSARLSHGEVRALCEAAAARCYERPDGRVVRLSWRTIERWYYDYHRGGLSALMPRTRKDAGSSAIRPEVAELLVRAKREKPRRSVRRLIKILERARVVRRGELSRSSVHRLLARHGISDRPGREGLVKERRAWIREHPGELWVGDALHLRRPVLHKGRRRKGYLLSQIDSATRYVPHSYVVISEGAVAQEYGLREAMLKSGRPREYYVDRGSAYIARSLRAICAELGIELTHADKQDAEAKGVIERWHRTWREEVEDELPEQEPISVDELNALHWAWLSREYHRREHDTTGRVPLEHWLAEAHHIRPLPPGVDLGEVFLHRAKRDVRKDGTVRWHGRLLEVHHSLAGRRRIELRFDPSDTGALPRVFVDGRFYCDTTKLDRVRNASRRRHRPRGEPAPDVEPTGLDPLRQLADEHYGLSRPPGADGDDEDDDIEDENER